MDSIRIEGGHTLCGEVETSGAKNASLPLMAATLLADSPSHLERIPHLHDIVTMGEMLSLLGARVSRGNGGLDIDPAGFVDAEAPYDLVRKMRASIYVLGPLLARFGHARVSLPGGCAIGNRPIDLHLRGFEALGAKITLEHGYVDAQAPAGGLVGGEFSLEGPSGSSVGATCNVLMAAVLARGRTVIYGAAREPEVDDLIGYLNQMGARIARAGARASDGAVSSSPSVLEIEGVERLSGCAYRVIPDRIEAGTFLVAAAMTRSEITVRNCRADHMRSTLDKLKEMGVRFEVSEDSIRVLPDGPLRPVAVRTLPYPGFPTDMQAQFLAALSLATGESTVTETIYPDRFIHAAELNRMGADIRVANATAAVHGVAQLTGATVMASDLRASAALVIAGLAAQGTTEILRVYHLDRGYERLEEKFRALGAVIERIAS
jgi:UDP-N-acetylglucosamine 1-carboxyvinyltransferase